ncbi:MAG: hypothetical protein KJO18_00365, partial [Acidimicrobiia bacterium]|nr:hypothetical protein [Acidimicrobiia bacterium]
SNSDNDGKPLFIGGLLTSLHVNNASNNGTHPGEYHFIDTGLVADEVTVLDATKGTVIYVEQSVNAWEINDTGNVTVVDGGGGGGTTSTTQPPATTTTTQPPGSTTTTQPPGSTTTTQPPGSTTTTSRPPRNTTTTTQQPPQSSTTTRPPRRGRPRDGVVEDGRGSEVPGSGESRSSFLGRLFNPFEVAGERSGAYGLTGTTAAVAAATGGTPTVGLVSQIGALSQPVPVVASAVGAGAVLLIKRRMLMAEAEVAQELAELDD